MKWFQHDTDAHRDLKLKRLSKEYGLEGLGLYWVIVEMIAEELSSKKLNCELEWTIDVIADEFKMSKDRVEAILGFCCGQQLFDRNQEGNIRCLKLLDRLDNTLSKNPEIALIKKQSEQFKKKRVAINQTKVIEVSARCGGKCMICGTKENLTIDHIIPQSKGGKDSVDNLQILCFSCNSRKHDKMPEETLLGTEDKLLPDYIRLEEKRA